MLTLRAHHGMCLAYFVGKGYSEAFTKKMWQVKEALEADQPIFLVARTDDICAACPNNRNGICQTQEKVVEYDTQVLRRCGLTAGSVLPFSVFAALVEQRILAPGKREEICGSCQWTALCHKKD